MVSSLLLFAAVVGLASAQSGAFTQCCNLTIGTQVTPAQAQTWCDAQDNTCPQLCGGQQNTNVSHCDAGTLTYTCECFQGRPPSNISDYGQTVPSLMCEQWVSECVVANTMNATAQDFCHSFKCGSKNATAYGLSVSSSLAAPTTTSMPTDSSTSTSAATQTTATTSSTTSTSTGAAIAVAVGNEYGTGFIGMLLFGLFGLAL